MSNKRRLWHPSAKGNIDGSEAHKLSDQISGFHRSGLKDQSCLKSATTSDCHGDMAGVLAPSALSQDRRLLLGGLVFVEERT